MRESFPKKIIEIIGKRAGYRCSNPACRKPTAGANEDENKATLVGEAAHIKAASEDGPRYDKNQKPEERVSAANGIWLCATCHTLVDKDYLRYPIELLYEWKARMEQESAELLEKGEKKEALKAHVASAEKTLEQKVEEGKLARRKVQERESFLRSTAAMEAAEAETQEVIRLLRVKKELLHDPETDFYLGTISGGRAYGFNRGKKYILFKSPNTPHFCHSVDDLLLRVLLYTREGHEGFPGFKEELVKEASYKYTRSLEGTSGWVDRETGKSFYTSGALVNLWVDTWYDWVHE